MIAKVKRVIKDPSMLGKVPSIIFTMVFAPKRFFNVRRNYKQFLSSGKKAITGDLPYDLNVVEKQFIDAGLTPTDYFIKVDAFKEYCSRHEGAYLDYREGYKELFVEKVLEHFVSLSFHELSADSKVIDIANAGSPFPEIVHGIHGCDVWSNDLDFPRGIHRKGWHTKIGGDACQLPVADSFFDLAVLHCALEMFEGEADTNLILKAQRILKPGGKLVIIPLYMNETYHVLRDIKTSRNPLPEIDEGAELVYRRDLHGVAFARFYSVDVFLKRVVGGAKNLTPSIYRVQNSAEINPRCYLNWIAVFEKKVLE
jgi:SAM-dependent methyltransferase